MQRGRLHEKIVALLLALATFGTALPTTLATLAGSAGASFKDAADLTAKLTAATGKYKANPDGGAPILAFETASTLSAGKGVAGYLNVRQSGTKHDLRILLSTTGDVTGADVRLTFTGGVSGVETSIGKSDSKFTEKTAVRAADIIYIPEAGGKIYSLVIPGLAGESWTKLTLEVISGGNTIMNGSVNYTDVFGEKVAAAIPFASLPDYPDGTVSPVYNAGPGKENDQKGLTGNESQMVVITKTTAASYESYLSGLEEAGYTKEAENKIENNLYCTMSREDTLIYLYHTAKSGETRIIWDRSSTTTLSKLSSAKIRTGTTELYQYAIDYTKATGQTWGGDYWQIDSGMNYVLKLPDNSVFLIDGGHERQSSRAALEAYDAFLHKITDTPAGEKVTIAGWFFSHAHGDHVYFAHAFLEKYHANYDLRCVYYNIPSYHTIGGSYDSGTFLMKDTVNKYYPNTDHIKLHTGQTFELQGVGVEVLFTHEDTVNVNGKSTISDFNETTTVIRFNIDGKTFIMLGDVATVAENTICSMFTKATLKSDAVQIAHHNYNNLPKLYPAIAANLLLVPNSRENSEQSHNQVKIDVAIKAATDPVILYEGDYTYKITVEDGQIKHAQMDRYTVGMEFTVPDLRYPADGPQTAETPVSDDILSGLVSLNDQIIDKSGFGTTGANGAEAPQCILDGNAATKWCVTGGAPAYVAWKMKNPVTVSAYQLYAGNDTEKFPQRSPKSWVLYGSADGKTWQVIDAVSDGGMSTANFSASAYKVDSPAKYQYFALKFFSYTSGDTMQLLDIALYGND